MTGDIDVNGCVRPWDNDVEVWDDEAQEAMPLSELLQDYPPTLYFADGTSAIGSYLHEPAMELPGLPDGILEPWDWSAVDIQAESRAAPRQGRQRIQDHVAAELVRQHDGALIIQDDGAHEIADLIAIVEQDGRARVSLIHCKGSKKPVPGPRVDDLYTVTGQAQRSVRWVTSAPDFWRTLRLRLDERQSTRVLYGEPACVRERLDSFIDETPPTEFSIIVVQPGLPLERLKRWPGGQTLITTCYEWVTEHNANFLLVGAAP